MKLKSITIFSLILFGLSLTLACKKDETSKTEPVTKAEAQAKVTKAVVVFSVGDVHSKERKLGLGDVLSEKEILITGKRSICDLQVMDSDAGIVIRIKAESEFNLHPAHAPDGSDVTMALRVGSGLFKVNNKLKKNEAVRIITPTMVMGVRGTSFSAAVSKKGDVSLVVLEGSVASRPAIAEIDALPEDIKANSETLKAVETSLAASEKVVEAGQNVTITKGYTDKILKDTGLKTIIPQIQESIKKGDLTAATQKLDAGDGTKEETKVKLTEKMAAVAPLKVESSKEKDIQKQLKEFEELIAIEKQKLDNEASLKTEITSRNKERKEILIKRIEQITGKSSETLLLKNGEKIHGVIFQEGETYHILTTEGKKSYSGSEVEGTEF